MVVCSRVSTEEEGVDVVVGEGGTEVGLNGGEEIGDAEGTVLGGVGGHHGGGVVDGVVGKSGDGGGTVAMDRQAKGKINDSVEMDAAEVRNLPSVLSIPRQRQNATHVAKQATSLAVV